MELHCGFVLYFSVQAGQNIMYKSNTADFAIYIHSRLTVNSQLSDWNWFQINFSFVWTDHKISSIAYQAVRLRRNLLLCQTVPAVQVPAQHVQM